MNIWWTGAKYTFRSKTDFTFSWYQQRQNDFRIPPTCSPSAGFRSSCAGTLNEGSLYADHHFTKRFDAYAGMHIPTLAAAWPSLFLISPASPISTTTTVPRPWGGVSPSDRFHSTEGDSALAMLARSSTCAASCEVRVKSKGVNSKDKTLEGPTQPPIAISSPTSFA